MSELEKAAKTFDELKAEYDKLWRAYALSDNRNEMLKSVEKMGTSKWVQIEYAQQYANEEFKKAMWAVQKLGQEYAKEIENLKIGYDKMQWESAVRSQENWDEAMQSIKLLETRLNRIGQLLDQIPSMFLHSSEGQNWVDSLKKILGE